MNHNIKVTVTITDEQIEDIMSSALRGITYWADEATVHGLIKNEDKDMNVSQALQRGYRIGIHDAEDEKYYQLTLRKFLNGIRLYGKYDFNNLDWDMEHADAVIQCALFGKQVYA